MQQPRLGSFLTIISLLTTLPVWGGACGVPGPHQIIVYQDRDLTGACARLGIGKYPRLSDLGVPNDSISSIEVGANVRAVLYQHANFKGLQAHFEGDFTRIGNAENRTSSIEVFPRYGGPSASYYLGNYPSNAETFWSQDAQGLANDRTNWFITTAPEYITHKGESEIYKVPLSSDLDSSRAPNLCRQGELNVRCRTGIPVGFKNQGYDHFGDLDQYQGLLFVPLEGGDNQKPRIMVFSTTDLQFLGSAELSDSPDHGAPWLAIRPNTGTLWVSTFNLSEGNQLREYEMDLSLPGGTLPLTFRRQVTLKDRSGVTMNLQSMQGGVFNSDGTLLYTSNGSCGGGYVHVFVIHDAANTAELQARSENGYGPFNFENHGGCALGDEPEGLDWLNVEGLNIPGIPHGQLHLIMVDNDTLDDDVYLKHYGYQ